MTRIQFVELPPFLDASKIEARLTVTLRGLRNHGQGQRRGHGSEGEGLLQKPDFHAISYDDSRKIRRRAVRLAELQAMAAGITHLKKEELARLAPVTTGVDLVMVGSEHQADEIAAALHAAMPWMAPATEHAWHALRRAVCRGEAICMRPIILNGPPGIGKSVWARRLARHLSLPCVDIDASKGGAGFALVGVERGWGSALPGRPLDLILTRRIGNPVVVIDEICKAKIANSDRGSTHSFADALLSLIEPATAAEWECGFFRLRFDMSRILWIMTANQVERAPEPVRSRCQIIRLSDITPEQMADFAILEGKRLGLSEAGIAAVVDAIGIAPRLLGRRLSLRDVIRMLERGEALEARPRLQ